MKCKKPKTRDYLKDQCEYEIGSDICINCGKNYEDVLSIWYKIYRVYFRNMPYCLRPGNIWYALKCWAWHRYSTIKPRVLNHQYIDRSDLIPHLIFEVLCQFVEKEMYKNSTDWNFGKWKNAEEKINELYNWYINILPKLEDDVGLNKILLGRSKEVIDITPFLWT